MITRGREAKMEIFRVAQLATAVYGTSSGGSGSSDGFDDDSAEGDDQEMGSTGSGGAVGEAAAAAAAAAASAAGSGSDAGSGGIGGEPELGGLSDADIEGMDAASLRRLLLARGQPASGRMSKLRERLREARDAAATA